MIIVRTDKGDIMVPFCECSQLWEMYIDDLSRCIYMTFLDVLIHDYVVSFAY